MEFRFSFRTGDNMDVSKTVRRIAIFGELNETESSAITDRVVQLDLKRGQELVRAGILNTTANIGFFRGQCAS